MSALHCMTLAAKRTRHTSSGRLAAPGPPQPLQLPSSSTQRPANPSKAAPPSPLQIHMVAKPQTQQTGYIVPHPALRHVPGRQQQAAKLCAGRAEAQPAVAVSQPRLPFPATLAAPACLACRRESLDVVGFVEERQREVYCDAYLASLPAVHQRRGSGLSAWSGGACWQVGGRALGQMPHCELAGLCQLGSHAFSCSACRSKDASGHACLPHASPACCCSARLCGAADRHL